MIMMGNLHFKMASLEKTHTVQEKRSSTKSERERIMAVTLISIGAFESDDIYLSTVSVCDPYRMTRRYATIRSESDDKQT